MIPSRNAGAFSSNTNALCGSAATECWAEGVNQTDYLLRRIPRRGGNVQTLVSVLKRERHRGGDTARTLRRIRLNGSDAGRAATIVAAGAQMFQPMVDGEVRLLLQKGGQPRHWQRRLRLYGWLEPREGGQRVWQPARDVGPSLAELSDPDGR